MAKVIEPTARTVRLVLGDQLNPNHWWFQQVDDQVVYVMMEVRQETDYVLHHAQKVLAMFAAMRSFASEIERHGHRVCYFRIGAAHNLQRLEANLRGLIEEVQASRFEWQSPDEYRVDQEMHAIAARLRCESAMVDSGHFYTLRHEVAEMFQGHSRRWLMETFYRNMRNKHGVLMEAKGKPLGGRWNFDQENRRAWRGDPKAPRRVHRSHDHTTLWREITEAGVKTFGLANADQFSWPLCRSEALADLQHFIDSGLEHFGAFQDAMASDQPYLFHAVLSFALNTKMLSPREVVEAAELAFRDGRAPLNAVEGFVRQILGWREYMRGVYWSKMPGYTDQNFFQTKRPLPQWFWTGKTSMNCLARVIGDSLRHAYAHHIQRLMITGNFMLLAGCDPAAVHAWYLGIYIDAIEWVEAPNTLGMSQFADGGQISTKPYVSSASYINKMSDYCKGCRYNHRQRIGPDACPFNALYWNFYSSHRDLLDTNQRVAMTYKSLDRMSLEEREEISTQSIIWLERIEDL